MGIRFFCPNGHKLNVKAFQAGKRGICPHCGSKFTIPEASTRPSSRGPADAPGKDSDEPEEQTVAEAGPAVGPAETVPNETKTMKTETVVIRPDRVIEPPPPLPPERTATPDPLAEAPDARWYVSPSGGGQFGPASAEIMRAWIAEGRVGTDSLVWREGWEDWQPAGDVFTELSDPFGGMALLGQISFSPAGSGSARISAPPGDSALGSPAPTAGASEAAIQVGGRSKPVTRTGRRKPVNRNLVVGLMLALIVALAAVLLWMLLR